MVEGISNSMDMSLSKLRALVMDRAVVHLRDGRFGLVEVKLGGEALIEEGAATLNALANAVDSEKMKKPSFRMVLTAVGDFAYTRPSDGVVVCPISALWP